MNLGKKIAKIRKDNEMSQEDFAEIFNVSRQTISSWENAKSYPDIETLVKLSDKFAISLDVLLKGDEVYIKKCTEELKKAHKYKKILIIIATIGLLIFVSFGSYFIIYKNKEDKLMNNFTETLEEYSFKKNRDGYYEMRDGNVTFGVPNQKMPGLLDFTLHFHNEVVYCDVYYEDGRHLSATWSDYDKYNFSLEKDNLVIGSSASLENKKDIASLSKELEISKEELTKIIKKANKLYKEFYL